MSTADGDEPRFGRDLRFTPRTRKWLYNTGLYGSVVTLAVLLGYPLYWMTQSAFQEEAHAYEALPTLTAIESLVEGFTVNQFEILMNETVGQYLLNSIIVTAGTVLSVLTISLIAGYGLARFDYKYKVATARFLLLGYMFSPIVLVIPLFLIWKELGLLNRYVGLILGLSALSMPFAVWLMWKYIQTIPDSLEESAWVAGASRFRGFWDVVVPQTKPAMIANAIFAFAIAWGDFTFSYIIMPDNAARTFPPGLFRMLSSTGWDTTWPEFMAVCFAVSLPALLFAFFLQSYLLRGFKIRAI